MKSALYLTFGFLILAVLGLWLWKIVHSDAEPPGRWVQDMVRRPLRPHVPPLAGAIPFERPESRALKEESGEELFLLHCAACHGADGSGQSFVAGQAGMPEVGNLRDTNSSPEELFHTLTAGRGAMPAFGLRLNERQRRLLILHLQTLHRP